MLVKYCATSGCPHHEHPLPESCGACPYCRSSALRLNMRQSGFSCPACERVNLRSATTCWYCQAAIHHGERSIAL